SFYESGSINSISLHKQTPVDTSVGSIPAELITFYESGAIKRIFPLNGKISGYWSEKDEYGLAQESEFTFVFGAVRAKIIGVQFYEEGMIKSLTFWPDQNIEIPTPVGIIKARIGLSFYPDGQIKSLEPAEPIPVNTPIGEIAAFDTSAIGINGDTNSLCFYKNGSIQSLVTSSDIVTVRKDSKSRIFGPGLRPSLLDSMKNEIVPLHLQFWEHFVLLSESSSEEYDINKYSFFVKHLSELLSHNCGSCESCSGCT
ncbi:MAG TPA: hypothetical protein VHT34_15005, partial [Clostridia bacterium]|nr:hypothetical protein [Clostridia bacterium]